jgi:hypothetical protein
VTVSGSGGGGGVANSPAARMAELWGRQIDCSK